MNHTSLILDAIVEENSNVIFSLFNCHFHFAKGNSGRSDYLCCAYALSKKMIRSIDSVDDIFGRYFRSEDWTAINCGYVRTQISYVTMCYWPDGVRTPCQASRT